MTSNGYVTSTAVFPFDIKMKKRKKNEKRQEDRGEIKKIQGSKDRTCKGASEKMPPR
jgi:hypothetical protein